MTETRHIKDEKFNEFYNDFKVHKGKWRKDQIDNDYQFDEETQLKIVKAEGNYASDISIAYIRNPTKKSIY